MKTAKTILAVLFAVVLALPAARAQEPKPAEKPEAKKDEKKKGLPLKTERKVEFTTDEGTWISLDVSPDGKTMTNTQTGTNASGQALNNVTVYDKQ